MRSGAAVIALQYGEVPLRSARSRLGRACRRARLGSVIDILQTNDVVYTEKFKRWR